MVLAVVGLARDGCLVRSWCRGRAAGGAAGRRERGVSGFGKANPTPPRSRGWGVLSRFIEKRRQIPYKQNPKRAHLKKTLSIKKTEKVNFSLQISENGVSKSILKELQKLIFSLQNSEKTCFFPHFLEVFKALESHFSLFDP